jgi:hypothetical protein
MKTKLLYVLTVLALLMPTGGIVAAPVPDDSSTPTVQEASVSYYLQLEIPDVKVSDEVRSSDVPGIYYSALARQWTEVEGVLTALQTQGLVETYTLLPKANAFSVTAEPTAKAQLVMLGALSEEGMATQAAKSVDFQARLNASIQTAQAQMTPLELPEAPTVSGNDNVVATVNRSGSSIQEAEYLVVLAAAEERYEVESYLAWLKDLDEVKAYAWLPKANAFKVSATSDLASLSKRSEVATLVPYSDDARREAESKAVASGDIEPMAAQSIQAYTPTTPTVRIDLYDNYVYAESYTNTTTVFTLTNGLGMVKDVETICSTWRSGCDDSWNGGWMGDYDIGVNFDSVNVEPTDTLEVAQEGEAPFTVDIPDLIALVDRDADTVSGRAPANISSTDPVTPPVLYLGARGINRDGSLWDWEYEYVTTDGNGNYSTVFTYTNPTTGTLDLRPPNTPPNMDGWVRYTDVQGNRVRLDYRAPELRVQAYDNWVNGNAGMPGAAVTVTLSSSTGTVKGQFTAMADNGGWFNGGLRDIYDNDVKTMPGDTVEMVTEYGTTVSVPVVELTALADTMADTVTGVGPADVAVTSTNYITLPGMVVDIYGYGDQWVTTDSDGNYVADDVGDFAPGDDGVVRYYNENGDYVDRYFRAPVVYVRGDSNGYRSDNYVNGYVAQGDVLVTLNLKRDGKTIAGAYDQADDNGHFSVNFFDTYDNPVNIQGGDTVEVVADGDTISVDVPNFDVSSNADTDTVSGNTDADVVTDTYGLTQTLTLWPDDLYDWDWPSESVIPDGSGDFSAVFTGTIDPGDHGHLRYINTAGHRVYDDFQAEQEVAGPIVYVRGQYWNNRYWSDDYVSGYVPGFCGYGTVTLKDSDGTVKAHNSSVYACYEFSLGLADKYGNAVDVESGDTVEAAFGGATTVVEVPNFDVTSDADTDTVSGTTDADVVRDTMTSYGMTQTLSIWPNTLSDYTGNSWQPLQNVRPDASDHFTATNPFYYYDYYWMGGWMTTTKDIQPGDHGHLRYIDADENRVYDDFQAPEEYAEPKVYLRGDTGAYRSENYIYVYNPDCGDVDVVLKDSSGTVKATATVYYACSGNTYLSEDIEPGDVVEATSGDQTTVVEVPTFDVNSDPDADALYGTTNATVVTDTNGMTQTLAVWPGVTPWGYTWDWEYDWNYGKHVLPDANGIFTATNPFYDDGYQTWDSRDLDWDPGQYGHLRYVNADDNRVYGKFAAPREEPEIHVHKYGTYVWGYVVTSEEGTPVTATLKSGATAKATAYDTADMSGYFNVTFYDDAGNPAIIEEGDDVVIAASSAVTVPVVPLTGQADVNADTVTGEGPVDDLVNVLVNWSDQTAATDSSGAYNADFKGIQDIGPGSSVRVQHRNDAGNYVYIQFHAGPKLNAQLNSYYAWGYSVAANAPVTVTLKDSSGAVKGRDTDVSNSNNYFSAYLYDATGQRAMIEADDVLEADFGNGEVVSMTVAGMTAEVDADNDTLSGTGPVSDTLGVQVGNNFDETVNTDGAGDWNADPGAEGEDITPGEQVTVRYVNDDDHETWLYAVAPVVYVRGWDRGANAYQDDNYVSGWAQGRSVIDVTLKRGTETIATQRLDHGWDNYSVHYSTYLYDALGQPADIQGGDQVIVSASPDETVDVPDIDAEVDAATDTITGTTTITDADLGVYVNGTGQTVHTDNNGDFVAVFDTINSYDHVYVRYQNGDGHWIHARFQGESTGDAAIYARWDGAMCNNCASGFVSTANALATVALERGGSTIATAIDRADSNRWFEVEFANAAGEAIPIENGDVIEVTASDPVSMTVADLTVEANKESDTLYGTGPAGDRLEIGGDCWGSTTVDPVGDWVYAGCGLGNGDNGYIYHPTENGHRTYLGWAAVPYVSVRENGDYVYGYVRQGVPVTVTLQSSGGTERAVATAFSNDSNGWFGVSFQDAAGDPIVIQPNDTVLVQASPAITVPVTPLDAEVDTANDQVMGYGPANADLGVSAGGCWRNVTTDADGDFTADTSGECNLRAGDWVWVYYWNDQGNQVYIGFNAPMVRVNVANDIVDGYATPNATAKLTLKRGGSTLATATASTGMGGWFSAFFTDANGDLVDIKSGDTVEVSASPTASVVLADLSAAVNTTEDTVTGSGPADAMLLVKVFSAGGGGWMTKSVTTDSNGDFTADFSGEMDLTETSYAYVSYSGANGNQTTIHTTPTRSTELEDAEQAVEARGASVEVSAFGAANDGDLTPPIIYRGGGGGKTVFAAEGGALVITHPDGSVNASGMNRVTIMNAPTGEWKVQVDVNGGEGEQYAVAIGRAAHSIYLPLVTR